MPYLPINMDDEMYQKIINELRNVVGELKNENQEMKRMIEELERRLRIYENPHVPFSKRFFKEKEESDHLIGKLTELVGVFSSL